MNRDRRSSSNDPTAEPASDQSTQSAGGVGPSHQGADADLVNREPAYRAPRRYEQPEADAGEGTRDKGSAI